jgi:hypothetical protein
VRAALLALAVAASSGCRLSDPYYIFKPLEPGKAPGPGFSLLYGTVELSPALAGIRLDAVVLRRISPEQSLTYWPVSETGLFRAFQRRSLHHGTFALHLPPGVYELDHLESWSWGQPTHWVLNEQTRIQSRVYITRPGVYDVGTLRITAPDGLTRPYHIESLGDAWSAQRYDALRVLVRGTAWAAEVP